MKKKKETYLPLWVMREISRLSPSMYGRGLLLDYLRRCGQNGSELGIKILDTMSEKDFDRYLVDKREFMSPEASPRGQILNHWMIEASTETLTADVKRRIMNGQAAIDAEMKDVFLFPGIWMRWNQNKQVYKPDADFAEALLETEELELTREQVDHLPVDTFYVDLSECSHFHPIVGGIVSVDRFPGRAGITVYLLTKDAAYFSQYSGGAYNEQGLLSLDIPKLVNPTPNEYDVHYPDGRLVHYALPEVGRTRMAMLCAQILCYLTSKKPDILDSPLTKHTYRPKETEGSARKVRWSDVEIHDVGVHYGAAIRAMKRGAASPEAGDGHASGTGGRKPPRPHFRRAHWQRYWTGKGRTTCEVVWCAPSFVGRAMEQADVTVHRIV